MVSAKKKKIAGTLVAIAFRPLFGDAADGIGRAIGSGPKDELERLMEAMADSQEKGWRALELGLRGDSVFRKAGSLFSSDKGKVQTQIRAFLEVLEQQGLDDEFAPIVNEDFKEKCLRELVTARKKSLIPGDKVPADQFSGEASVFQAAATTDDVRNAEAEMLRYVGASLAVNGFTNLSSYISMAPKDGTPILIIAVQYFFRRAVEDDPALANLLQVQRLEKMNDALTAALGQLDNGFRQLGNQLSEAFDGLSSQVGKVQEGVDELHGKIDDWKLREAERQEAIDAERKMMMAMIQQMSSQIAQLSNQTSFPPTEINPDDAVAVERIRNAAEEAIRVKSKSQSMEDQIHLADLREITKKFDTVRKRLFNHLPSTNAAQTASVLPAMSENAGGVFRVNRNTRKKNPVTRKPASFKLALSGTYATATESRVQIFNDKGLLIRDLTTESDGTIGRIDLPSGNYILRLANHSDCEKNIDLQPGDNGTTYWITEND